MSRTINSRLPLHVEQKLEAYCARVGVTRSEALVRALDRYLDQESGGADAYSLAADLIPAEGVKGIQAADARILARNAFRGSRSR
jgi:predicted DNA-binding protein